MMCMFQKFRLGKQPHKDYNDHSMKDGERGDLIHLFCFMHTHVCVCMYTFNLIFISLKPLTVYIYIDSQIIGTCNCSFIFRTSKK